MSEPLETRSRRIAEIPAGHRLFALSDDLESIALVTDDPDTLTLNGVEVAFEEAIAGGCFSPTGVFAFQEGNEKKWRYRIGDQAGPWFERVGDLSFSPDGSHHVYKACHVRGKGYSRDPVVNYGRWMLMVDGERRWPEFNVVHSLVTNQGRVAFSAQLDPAGSAVVLNGETVAESAESRMFKDLAFSPDSTRLGYVEEIDAHRVRVACGDYRSEVGSTHVMTSGFSPANEFYHQLTISPLTDYRLIIGEQRLRTAGAVTHVFFGPDGSLLAYVELADFPDHRLIYPGGESLPLPYIELSAAHPGTGKFALVCNQGRPSLVTSPSAVWYDGKLTERYDDVLWKHFRFTEDGTAIRFVAVQGNLLVLHEIDTSKEKA